MHKHKTRLPRLPWQPCFVGMIVVKRLPFNADAQRHPGGADFTVAMDIVPVFVVARIILGDFVVVSASHHHADGEVALGSETYAKGKVAVCTHIVADEGTEAHADNGTHNLGVVELITDIGVDGHQSAVFVEINADTHASVNATVEIEAMGG